MVENVMILNGEDIRVKKMELDNTSLYIESVKRNYSLVIHIYNWEKIWNIETGKEEKINFKEYYLTKDYGAALIWPTECLVKKLDEKNISIYLKFDDFSNACYMTGKEAFDVSLKQMIVKVKVCYESLKSLVQTQVLLSLLKERFVK